MKRHIYRKKGCANKVFSTEDIETQREKSIQKSYILEISDKETIMDMKKQDIQYMKFLTDTLVEKINIISDTTYLNYIKGKEEIDNYVHVESDDKKSIDIDTESSKQEHKCIHCEHVFKSKHGLIKHMRGGRRCEYNRMVNKLMTHREFHEVVTENVPNININQTIQNIQNNLTSVNEISLKDFIVDDYEWRHIHPDELQEETFYEIGKFFKMVLRNDVNKNMYVMNDEIIFYSNHQLMKANKEKCVYMVIDKLSSIVSSLVDNNHNISVKDKVKIKRYYHVAKGKYKNDTLFRKYDVKTGTYSRASTNGIVWMRNMVISSISNVAGSVEKVTKNLFDRLDIENKKVEFIDLNINGFVSNRMRYKELKERDS